jgi:hypothetical protein
MIVTAVAQKLNWKYQKEYSHALKPTVIKPENPAK